MNFTNNKKKKKIIGCNCLYNEKKMAEKICQEKTPVLGARYLYR